MALFCGEDTTRDQAVNVVISTLITRSNTNSTYTVHVPPNIPVSVIIADFYLLGLQSIKAIKVENVSSL